MDDLRRLADLAADDRAPERRLVRDLGHVALEHARLDRRHHLHPHLGRRALVAQQDAVAELDAAVVRVVDDLGARELVLEVVDPVLDAALLLLRLLEPESS
jgi:hypothetical protein